MTPPSNAGGEGREVLAREVLAEVHREHRTSALVHTGGEESVIAAMLAFSARENATDRAPALVETAVAEMRERAAKVAEAHGPGGWHYESHYDAPMIIHSVAAAIRALGTPSQEASNVG